MPDDICRIRGAAHGLRHTTGNMRRAACSFAWRVQQRSVVGRMAVSENGLRCGGNVDSGVPNVP
eukprot:349850-Chlamydomonas_euryale.AAC.12